MTGPFLIGGELPVRRIGFGGLRLTGPDHWGPPPDRGAAIAVLREAVELGVEFVDTADSYGLGDNEDLIAEALRPYPPGVLVATKVGQSRPRPHVWEPLGRPAYLRQQVELSLRRLRMDRIDLLSLHRVDPAVPLPDQVGTLVELRDEGKIRHIGLSGVSVGQVDEAARITPIAAVQNPYDLAFRRDHDVLEHCAARGIAFTCYRPLGGGRLARAPGPVAVARRHGASVAQVALAWLLHRAPVTIPIPGTARPDHLRENAAAATLQLSDGDLRLLADVPGGTA